MGSLKPATAHNLEKIDYENIFIFRKNKTVDFISKDLNSDYCPFNIIGSNETYNAKEIINILNLTKEDYLADANKFSR